MLSPAIDRVDRTGTMRSGCKIVFVAQVVFAFNVETRAACVPEPSPLNVIAKGCAIELAFTSFKHIFPREAVTE